MVGWLILLPGGALKFLFHRLDAVNKSTVLLQHVWNPILTWLVLLRE